MTARELFLLRPSPIRTARVARGMTQARLAAETGYTVSYLATIEREPRLLRRPMAERLAAVLGVPADDLLANEARP